MNEFTRFVNFAVDGVSVESVDVRRSICDFLSCSTNYTGTTNPNHNIKSYRYQIIGGSCAPTIGACTVDIDLIRVSSISMDLYRPTDFASDLLVLKLISLDGISKLLILSELPDTDFGARDIGLVSLTILFMRLHLYAINCDSISSFHQAVYLCMSMIWLTTLTGVCMITKRNIVSETISFIFIVVQDNISKPRN